MGRYDTIIAQAMALAERDDNVRALLIMGSQARPHQPADAWSDLDLYWIVRDPAPLMNTSAWLSSLGEVKLSFIEKDGANGEYERRALFAGGLDVDFNIIPLAAVEHGLGHEAIDIVQRGYRVLLDKTGLATALLAAAHLPQRMFEAPPLAAFDNLVNDFWYHAVWVARKWRRGELWTAMGGLNRYMLWECLLPMLTWQAHLMGGETRDTWYAGRFIEAWADAQALADLSGVVAHYDVEDLAQSLSRMMTLFAWVSRAVAAELGYAYPEEAQRTASEWVGSMLANLDDLAE